MLGTAIVGYGGGHAGSIGAGGYRDVSAGRSVPRTRIGPALHSVPDTAAVLLL